jgi:hypothetical protein
MFSSAAATEPGDYIDMKAAVNKLIVVRPLEYRTDFKTTFSPDGTDVVFADIAVVDDVDPQTGLQGRVYRSQAILQGHLKGTFKRHLGEMLVGLLYLGAPTKGRPPFLWHDLHGDPNAVARAQAWVVANQSFLAPVTATAPAAPVQPPAPPAYQPPVYQAPTYQAPSYQTPGYATPAAPVSAQPVSAYPVSPATPAPAAAPAPAEARVTTLDQLRAMNLANPQPDAGIPF